LFTGTLYNQSRWQLIEPHLISSFANELIYANLQRKAGPPIALIDCFRRSLVALGRIEALSRSTLIPKAVFASTSSTTHRDWVE
jgi:hypothetical protein